MDRRHGAVHRAPPRGRSIRARASGARGCDGGRGVARGGNRQGQGRRHARGPDRAARAARRRGGNLYRGRARSRRRPAAQPHVAADAADRIASRCAPPSPTRAAGSAARARLRRMRRAKADAWFDGVARSIEPGKPIAAQLAAKLKELPGAALTSWIAESCTGSYPLSAVASSRAPGKDAPVNGQFLVLTVELTLDGAPWLGAAPLIVGARALDSRSSLPHLIRQSMMTPRCKRKVALPHGCPGQARA